MQDLKESVLTCIKDNAGTGTYLVDRLNRIVEITGDVACTEIFKILTNLEFTPPDAQSYWYKVCDHKLWLEDRLKRDVTLRTAICDFFSSKDVFLINPQIIEIHDFEEKILTSRIDFLTGLYSRKYFEERLEEEFKRSKRNRSELALIFFELDHFKRINDTYGHLAGDHILREVSKIIIENRRDGDITGRYGGEELVILLPHTNKMQALIYAERIRETIERKIFVFESLDIKVTISGGIGSLPMDGTEAKSLIKAADLALYAAKEVGINEIIVYSSDKRQYLRVDLVSEINIINMGDNDSDSIDRKSKNLSKNGILFESNKPFKMGSQIQLKIYIDEKTAPIVVSGNIVRVEIFKENQYDIGVSFEELEKEIKQGISHHIIDHLKLNTLNNTPAISANF